LQERRDDIPLLINKFIDKFNHRMGKNVLSISNSVLSLLMKYKYTGNVRELENIIEHSMVMCNSEEILIDHLPVEFLEDEIVLPTSSLSEDPLQKTEGQAILESLNKYDWNKNKVAKDLNIHRSTLWRKMKKHGLE